MQAGFEPDEFCTKTVSSDPGRTSPSGSVAMPPPCRGLPPDGDKKGADGDFDFPDTGEGPVGSETGQEYLLSPVGLCNEPSAGTCPAPGGETVHTEGLDSGGDVTSVNDVAIVDRYVTEGIDVMPMDCSSIIPEAAMQCGILPMDANEDDSLNPMSSREGVVVASPPDLSTEAQQTCVGCKRPITERYLLKVMDQFWHEDCLKCSCCDCRLGEVGSTLFTKANLLLCRRDYLRLFGATGCCSVCSKMIPAFEMVMKAKGNVYHLECFACQQCNHRFCIGDRYYLYDNKILCEFDYEERLVFARISHGYNALTNIKRQTQAINSTTGSNSSNSARSSNLNGC